MHNTSSGIVYSPHDLMAFLASDFIAWMDRLNFELERNNATPFCLGIPREAFKPDDDEELDVLRARGLQHEKNYVAKLKQDNDVLLIGNQNPRDDTIAAMQEGQAVIYQGRLQHGQFGGSPDFLIKKPGRSNLGEWHYVPCDTKLSKSVKPEHAIQLCAYASMLEGLQGLRPSEMQFVLGNQSLKTLQVDHYFYYFKQLRDKFLRFQKSFDPNAVPNPGLARDFGRWSTVAALLLETTDHVSRTARITCTQVQRLESAGITTMTQLAARTAAVPRIQPQVLDRLTRQASLQLQSQGKAKPTFEVVTPDEEDPHRGLAILPPPNSGDIFFDMEGFPLAENGLEYLFGAVTRKANGKLEFDDWWAHDEIHERLAFEQFVDWAHARWKRDPSLHIYHYASYEPAALRRLMNKHASREAKVDDLLRNKVFVDLYTIVRQGLLVGTSGYSLKDIECLFAPPRTGAIVTAAGSMVAYQKWIESGQSSDWSESAILKEIRDYNEIDCLSLTHLQKWLVGLQTTYDIPYRPLASSAGNVQEGKANQPKERPGAILAEKTLQELAEANEDSDERSEKSQRNELLAYLLEFHWREAKPVFWRKFDRHEMTEQELVDDLDCLGGLKRTAKPPADSSYEYAFDREQDTKLRKGSKCFFAHDLSQKCQIAEMGEIDEMDEQKGLVLLKLPKKHTPPASSCSLIPDEYVSADVIADAVYRYVEAWTRGKSLSQAIDDLLDRRPPRIKGHTQGPLINPKKELLPQLIDVATRLDRSTLCIQGPPGTGKTYSIGKVIATLLGMGKRIGVTALSHKAILNALHSVAAATGGDAAIYKVGGGDADAEDPLVQEGRITVLRTEGGIELGAALGSFVIGGTAWFFSRSEMSKKLDYLVVDEAGQFSLANVIGTGLAAQNLILVGDQMQLAQPTQAVHPGNSGMSGLDYLLNERATVPPEFGVLLNRTYRLHPEICNFVSALTYDGRLEADGQTAKRRLVPPSNAKMLQRGTGIHFHAVSHKGNSQCSDEEIAHIAALCDELLESDFVDEKGERRNISLNDILVVAPYNMQVVRLQKNLPKDARIGSVDKFQGQEAPVVIISMCGSSLEDSPRGATFLLNPNRLNVAISRAKCLTIVVACPDLLAPRCSTLKEIELTNAFCWLEDYSATLT